MTNLFERAKNNSAQFLEDRPTLKESQNPEIVAQLILGEVVEFVDALRGGVREEILDEFTDVVNYVAQSLASLAEDYGITEQEIADRSDYKYKVRNEHKYPKDNYQDGDPVEARNGNILRWTLLQVYHNTPEQGLGNEYY